MTMENDLVERRAAEECPKTMPANWPSVLESRARAGYVNDSEGSRLLMFQTATLIRTKDARIQALEAELAREKSEKAAAQRSLEHDRTRVIDLVNAISDEFERRSWLMSSRGSYEWDDERFQQEFADAVEAMRPHVAAMRKIGGDWSNCPMTGTQVTAARLDLEAGLARKTEALERIERWFGEFPETGTFWDDGSPQSYATLYGSNGERDFMRSIARSALEEKTDV